MILDQISYVRHNSFPAWLVLKIALVGKPTGVERPKIKTKPNFDIFSLDIN